MNASPNNTPNQSTPTPITPTTPAISSPSKPGLLPNTDPQAAGTLGTPATELQGQAGAAVAVAPQATTTR